ncbi:MAG: hypothetical protein M3R27_12880 [Bacteroidota bacterium]|nr:hypothetical protein [Bacteroidota bacterium]
MNPFRQHTCELKSFSAEQIAERVFFTWTVSSDLDNFYCVLESTTDEVRWRTIGIEKCESKDLKELITFRHIFLNFSNTPTIYRIRAVTPVNIGNELLLYSNGVDFFEGLSMARIQIKKDNAKVNDSTFRF